jgi:tetratricopeptide (TPR) repeat protein
MYRQALEGYNMVLGPEHPNTLKDMGNLGHLLMRMGWYDEAEGKIQQALQGREKVLGLDHPDTLDNISHLAFVLEKQGKFAEADLIRQRGRVL